MRKTLLIILLVSNLLALLSLKYVFPAISTNNRFVVYVALLAVNIIAIIFFVIKQKLLRNLLISIVAMSAFAFLLVPLYDAFCAVTGLNGKMDLTVAAATTKDIDYSRNVTVEFVVSQNQAMPWEFKPKHTFLTIHPGQLADTAYFAKNPTRGTMFAQAIPSITPAIARKYFKKVECFCFSKQKLGPQESAHLGLRFYLEPDLPKEVSRITLAYTIFDITQQEH